MSRRVRGFPDELQELINMLLYFHLWFLPISELSFLLPLPQTSAVGTAAAVLAVWAAFKSVTQSK